MGNLIMTQLGKILAGQVRTAMAFGGGYLVSKGFDPQQVGQVTSCLSDPVAGLILSGVAGLWSAKSKVVVAETKKYPE